MQLLPSASRCGVSNRASSSYEKRPWSGGIHNQELCAFNAKMASTTERSKPVAQAPFRRLLRGGRGMRVPTTTHYEFGFWFHKSPSAPLTFGTIAEASQVPPSHQMSSRLERAGAWRRPPRRGHNNDRPLGGFQRFLPTRTDDAAVSSQQERATALEHLLAFLVEIGAFDAIGAADANIVGGGNALAAPVEADEKIEFPPMLKD